MSLVNDAVIGRTDTRELAARWIDANLPADATIAIESFAQVDYKFQWTGYEGRSSFPYWTGTEASRARATSGEFSYLVLSSFSYGPWETLQAPAADTPAVYRDSLDGKATLLANFGAGAGNREVPYSWDDLYTPFWHLLDRERPGPTIKIYRIH
jgi:hypothetical protein